MSQLYSMIRGNHIFSKSGTFEGMIAKDAVIEEGVELTLKGMVGGNVVVKPGAALYLKAMVGGCIHNQGGRLHPAT
ncbi:hypothetical protein [Celeribacter persicus]|jgi:hypothetical protein|uniref:Polymer-forming protein n=1 Tax=Celeribacter persicus TaxID=1651082 RepID=A0A2T5HVZ7_9RHOB|nr:hypothetical protein [Celeribacter persicus]PTQ75760.1 hypothetical protein C8N42_101301 [Celeribacter persicus]